MKTSTKKMKNPLNGRGNATVIAAPVGFGVAEMLFHAHPLVGGAVGLVMGALAYRHFEDVEASVGHLTAAIVRDYVPQEINKATLSGDSQRIQEDAPSSQNAQEGAPRDIRDIPIPIGSLRNGKRFERTLRQLKSILILGLQEGGKTNSAIHLIRHFVKHGAHLAIIDKHARSEEDSMTQKLSPLESRFDCPVGYNPETALKVVGHVKAILDERLEGAKCSYPIFIVVDEFTAIMRQTNGGKWQAVAKALEELIGDINQEGRKHQVFAICVGQIANASSTGGTEIRELFATRITHAMSVQQANILGLKEVNRQVQALGKGECFFQTEGFSPFWLKIPYVEEEQLRRLAKSLPPIEKPKPREEIDREVFSGVDASLPKKGISKPNSLPFPAQNTRILPETEMEMLPGNGKMEMQKDTFTSAAQELVNFLENSGKCPDALILVREQSLNFASGAENRTISQIAKDWGFESGRNWQKATGLLEALKSAVEDQEE